MRLALHRRHILCLVQACIQIYGQVQSLIVGKPAVLVHVVRIKFGSCRLLPRFISHVARAEYNRSQAQLRHFGHRHPWLHKHKRFPRPCFRDAHADSNKDAGLASGGETIMRLCVGACMSTSRKILPTCKVSLFPSMPRLS